eukprot:TRINITY_DN13490_c0_g1_i1.p1 TRINITY_DN13490_c0_g1~~TRINITY_DN13490_c0_g1_i1.p1  ORF type:complete len:539 (-),score=91.33 TRINITY_DN13490_c0_g1_i1:148-1764(-)
MESRGPLLSIMPREPRKIFVGRGGGSNEILFRETRKTQIGKGTGSSESTEIAQRVSPTADYAFSDVVDEDNDQKYENYLTEDLLGTLLNSKYFRFGILIVILVNSVVIGLQTNDTISKNAPNVFSALDTTFLTIFVVEIGVKWYHGFLDFWKIGWNVFDFIIVAVSLLGQVSFVSSGRVLRIFRVLRAFRTLRSISILNGLQIVVASVIRSLPDMGNVVLLMLLIMFIFSVLGVSLFAAAAPALFGNMALAMYSLFICITQDGWLSLFETMDSVGQYTAAAVYFGAFLALGAWIMVNIIVGVTVTALQTTFRNLKRNRASKYRQLGKRAPGAPMNQRTVRTKDKPVKIHNVQSVVWSAQRPLELAKFAKLSTSTLSSYYLVLSAIEDNLGEFADMKGKLEEILREVKEMNVELTLQRLADDVDQAEGDAIAHSEAFKRRGDVLSELILRAQVENREAQKQKVLREKIARSRRDREERSKQEQRTRDERARMFAAGTLNRFSVVPGLQTLPSPQPPMRMLQRRQSVTGQRMQAMMDENQ